MVMGAGGDQEQYVDLDMRPNYNILLFWLAGCQSEMSKPVVICLLWKHIPSPDWSLHGGKDYRKPLV